MIGLAVQDCDAACDDKRLRSLFEVRIMVHVGDIKIHARDKN